MARTGTPTRLIGIPNPSIPVQVAPAEGKMKWSQ
jgi:hypothetical protein